MGMQFFDVAVYAIGAGGLCLVVYRGLQGVSFGEIWHYPDVPQSTAAEVILGAAVGAIAGVMGIAFRRCEVEPQLYTYGNSVSYHSSTTARAEEAILCFE